MLLLALGFTDGEAPETERAATQIRKSTLVLRSSAQKLNTKSSSRQISSCPSLPTFNQSELHLVNTLTSFNNFLCMYTYLDGTQKIIEIIRDGLNLNLATQV